MEDIITKDLEDIFKGMADDGNIGGVFMATPTGKVLDEDKSYIEVLIYGKSYFAKPCMAFGSYNVPDETWLNKYKDEIMVWVAFENGNPAHPVYLGVAPRDEKFPAGNFPEIKEYKTTEFKYSFDDKKKLFNFSKINPKNDNIEYSIDAEKNKISIKDQKNNRFILDFNTGKIEMINSKKNGVILSDFTTLGKGTGAMSAVLGETMIALIGQIQVQINSALGILSSATVTVNPTTFIGTFNPSVVIGLATISAQISQIQGQLATSLSKNVKLD